MNIRIAVIAPYDELVADIRNLPASTTSVWQVRPGNLEEGVKVGRTVEKQGADVIVSRGGTADSIRNAVSIPVVEIEVSGFDLMRALSSLRDDYTHFGFVGFPNVIKGIRQLGALLGFSIKEYAIESETQVIDAIERAKTDHVECIVGDKIAVDIAGKVGLPAQLIRSGPESISRALDEAYRVARMRKNEQNRIHQLRAILDTVSDGVVVSDGNGIITELNGVAIRLLDVQGGNPSDSDFVGKRIQEVIPDWSTAVVKKQTNDFITKIKNGRTLFCTARPMLDGDNQSGTILILQDVRQLQRTEETVRRKLNTPGHTARYTFADIVADSQLMKESLNKLAAYAQVDSTVLILGESGCGKELAAQSVHNASPRKSGPFVAVNCAALPPNLLETELFGYDEGAFTGARRSGKKGVFELAHNGTIFLDEIAEMPLELQGRLLRVLEEREIVRVGGETVIPVDIRVIAATNRDLKQEVAQGHFREDLFYRINVLLVEIPSLRARKEDIVTLAHVFLDRLKTRYNRDLQWKQSGIDALLQYEWPGNVRELENIVERLVLTSQRPYLDHSIVEAMIGSMKPEDQSSHRHLSHRAEETGDLTSPVIDRKTYETQMIVQLLQRGFTHEQIASRLQISRTTVWRRLKEVRLDESMNPELN